MPKLMMGGGVRSKVGAAVSSSSPSSAGEEVVAAARDDAEVVTALEREAVALSQRPFMTFSDIWLPMLRKSNEDSYNSTEGMMGTIGIIAALLMSFIYGENGKELTHSVNCLWVELGSAQWLEFARNLYTLLCGLITVMCFATVCVSSRVYMDLLMLPRSMTTAAVAGIGGIVMIEFIYIPFFLITVLTLVVLILNLTIVLPFAMGIIALTFTLVFAASSIYTFVHCDKTVQRIFLDYERAHATKNQPNNAALC